MNFLPTDIQNIIMNNVYHLEHKEKYENVLNELIFSVESCLSCKDTLVFYKKDIICNECKLNYDSYNIEYDNIDDADIYELYF